MNAAPVSADRSRWVIPCAALLAVAVFVPGRLEYSNCDEYLARAFGSGFLGAFREMLGMDAEQGRFRPMYWLLQGALGALAGPSATALVVLRLVALAASVWLQIRISLRLGAGVVTAALLAVALAWSRPALAIWTPAGPAEAFGNPLALACTLLVLRAGGVPGILGATAVGLAAALSKESYGAWTAAALGAFALAELLRGRRGAPFWTALAGATVQLVPAAIAALAVGNWSSSYLAYALTGLRASPSVTATVALDQNFVAVVLGLAGLAIVLRDVARRRPAEWALADLVLLSVLASAIVVTFALGFVMPRYHLPLGTALLLVVARASRALAVLRGRRTTLTFAAVLAVVVAAAGARAVVEARNAQAMRRLDEGLRAQLRDALSRYGAARVYWYPDYVELPIGALRHVGIEGIHGAVELKPCVAPAAASAELLNGLFRTHSVAVDRPSPVIASTWCPGVRGRAAEQECQLVLPGLRGLWPRYACRWRPDLSQVVYRP